MGKYMWVILKTINMKEKECDLFLIEKNMNDFSMKVTWKEKEHDFILIKVNSKPFGKREKGW